MTIPSFVLYLSSQPDYTGYPAKVLNVSSSIPRNSRLYPGLLTHASLKFIQKLPEEFQRLIYGRFQTYLRRRVLKAPLAP